MCDRYEWLARLKPNSWGIDMNEHACNYCTAEYWIENNPDLFDDCPASLVDGMKASNTIFRLQIYPATPIAFNWWCGPTLDSVIDQARAADQSSGDRNA